MLKKITQFIKYNTLVAAIIAVAFIAVASALAANDDVKKIIGEEVVERSGVDNTVLLAADLENFDLKMEITNALEDEENYYVNYQYDTLAIKDNVWREVLKQEQIIVSKAALAGEDLGLYLMEELGEVIDYQLAFLKEVQEKEEEKGVTVVLEKTEYTGLIGLVFNTKTKELPGYEPVVKPPVAEVAEETTPETELSSGYPELSSNQENYDDYTGAPEENNYPDDAPVWEQLESNCLADGGFWYNKKCNETCEEITFYLDADGDGFGIAADSSVACEQPDGYIDNSDDCDDNDFEINPNAVEICGNGVDENCDGADDVCDIVSDICDANNLDLCDIQEDCETAGGYWYDSDGDDNEICNAMAQETACVPDWECSEWDLDVSDVACGDAFTQTRNCEDLNNCGTDQDKPSETQDAVGTDDLECGVTSCDGENLVGECNNTCGIDGCEDCVPTCVLQVSDTL